MSHLHGQSFQHRKQNKKIAIKMASPYAQFVFPEKRNNQKRQSQICDVVCTVCDPPKLYVQCFMLEQER